MKTLNKFMMLLAAITIFYSCIEEETFQTHPHASLVIANAVFGGSPVKLGNNATSIAVNNANGTQLILTPGINNLYVWPTTDSLKPYYTHSNLSVENKDVYSLFLHGTPEATDGILIKENLPHHAAADSTWAVRFINLAPNSTPLNITLSTSPSVNEVTGLAYGKYTDFITYSAKMGYSFQMRYANNPDVALSPAINNFIAPPIYCNMTAVIRQNGANLAVFVVGHEW